MRMQVWYDHYAPELLIMFKMLVERHPELAGEYKSFCEMLFLARRDDLLN